MGFTLTKHRHSSDCCGFKHAELMPHSVPLSFNIMNYILNYLNELRFHPPPITSRHIHETGSAVNQPEKWSLHPQMLPPYTSPLGEDQLLARPPGHCEYRINIHSYSRISLWLYNILIQNCQILSGKCGKLLICRTGRKKSVCVGVFLQCQDWYFSTPGIIVRYIQSISIRWKFTYGPPNVFLTFWRRELFF